jgi:hypothetical protein
MAPVARSEANSRLLFRYRSRIQDEGFYSIRLEDFSVASLPAIARREKLRYLAVSTTLAYGYYDAVAPLRKRTPVDRTQTF